MAFQIGIEPVRIEILTSIDGGEFGPAFDARAIFVIEGQQVPLLSLNPSTRESYREGFTHRRAKPSVLNVF